MKKLFAGIITAILMLSLFMASSAAETISKQNGSKQIDVQAMTAYIGPENMFIKDVSDGNASITTKSGTTVSVTASGTTLDGLTLNVIAMVSSDKDAYEWIQGIMNGLCDEFTAYNIFFTDKDGNRVAVTENVSVSITTPDGYTNVQVYHINSNGLKDKVTSEQSEKNTVFNTSAFNYYVLVDDAKDDSSATAPISRDTSTASDAPLTGDESNAVLWLGFLFASAGAFTVLCFVRKHRKVQ